jgi:amino acid transporter
MGTPRIVYKMAKDGLMFEWLTVVNSHGSPVNAAILCGLLSTLLAGFLHFEPLASSCSAATLFMFVIVCVGVVIVRVSEHQSPVHPHAIKKLTISLVLFCFVSLIASICLVEESLVSKSTLYLILVVNVLSGVYVWNSYRWALDSRFLDHPLLTNEVTLTTVAPKTKRDVYLCPLVPTVPLLAAWIDIFMMASVGFTALGGLVALLAIGLAIYFAYGIRHSKLGRV